MTYASKYPSKLSDIPEGTAFIVLCNDTVSEHDYHSNSASNRNVVKVLTFDTEELMKQYIIEELQSTEWRKAKSPLDFRILRYNPISVKINTEFNFD